MARSSALRGSRIGSGPLGEPERGDLIERVTVAFWCASGHLTRPLFAATAVIPDVWECHRCGQPAGQDRDNPPPALNVEPYKTHLAYLRERRSDADAEILLAEALARLRATA
jgi:hypothetical protein